MHYRVHSTKVKAYKWCATRRDAIAAFERKCKRAGVEPPLRYPPSVGGDTIMTNGISLTRAVTLLLVCAMVTGGCSFDAHNDVLRR